MSLTRSRRALLLGASRRGGHSLLLCLSGVEHGQRAFDESVRKRGRIIDVWERDGRHRYLEELAQWSPTIGGLPLEQPLGRNRVPDLLVVALHGGSKGGAIERSAHVPDQAASPEHCAHEISKSPPGWVDGAAGVRQVPHQHVSAKGTPDRVLYAGRPALAAAHAQQDLG